MKLIAVNTSLAINLSFTLSSRGMLALLGGTGLTRVELLGVAIGIHPDGKLRRQIAVIEIAQRLRTSEPFSDHAEDCSSLLHNALLKSSAPD